MQRTIQSFRRSGSFLTLGLVLAWGCFYFALRSSSEPRSLSLSRNQNDDASVLAQVPPDDEEDEAATDPLEYEREHFACADLDMAALGVILEGEDFVLHSPPALASSRFGARDYGGAALAEILLDLLRPLGHGFFRQGNEIHVVEMRVQRERREPGAGGESTDLVRPYQSNKLKTTVRVRTGEAVDLWIDGSPLLRLRIVAQPLYGESATDRVMISVQGRRNQCAWFHHAVETRMDQAVRIDVKGAELMWCIITPSALEDPGSQTPSAITLEVEFYHESTIPPA
ncbi:MAG TPA: hypothetical protein VM492_06255 [Sumerlaeia bacterium]|nr:hypothetical protein [Sumerlaeia bacterium]